MTASRPSQTIAQTGPEPMSNMVSVGVVADEAIDGAHTGNQTGEEGLAGQVGIVLLQVLLGGSHKLDGGELEAAVLEAGDDGADQAALRGRLVAWTADEAIDIPGRHQA